MNSSHASNLLLAMSFYVSHKLRELVFKFVFFLALDVPCILLSITYEEQSKVKTRLRLFLDKNNKLISSYICTLDV